MAQELTGRSGDEPLIHCSASPPLLMLCWWDIEDITGIGARALSIPEIDPPSSHRTWESG